MDNRIAFFVSIGAIILAGFSLVVDWQQLQIIQETNSPADIIACIKSFDYEKGQEYDSGGSAVFNGKISFDLVNRGNTDATVHRVDVFPVGETEDGGKRNMWFTLEVQQPVQKLRLQISYSKH